ncbi:DUF6174 domain-containing protein [Deinococcus radiomollis]|uniref:DUF6174 domain-containing protein n=1 Tax=Deinococcus radiomollis TaxID=468916 RepID=UPI00389125BA
MNLARLAPLLLTLSTSVLAGGAGGPAPASGCVPGFVQPSPAALTRALAAAQVRWKATGIHDYSYTFEQIAQPVRFPPTRIEVSGKAVRATALTGGDPSVYAQKASVEGLYRFIRDAIAFARSEPCAELKVEYAPDGRPLRFSSQLQTPITANAIADGGASWTVSDFRRR